MKKKKRSQMDCPHWRVGRAYHRRWACKACDQVFVLDYLYGRDLAPLRGELMAEERLRRSAEERYRSAEQVLADIKAAFGVKKIQELLNIAHEHA